MTPPIINMIPQDCDAITQRLTENNNGGCLGLNVKTLLKTFSYSTSKLHVSIVLILSPLLFIFIHVMQEKTYLKVVLLGKVNSGKTCLVTRYITRAFSEETPSTIGAAFCRKDLYIQGKNLSLAIWDTAGAERYQAMSAMYYRSARAAIICYDLTDVGSFDKAKFWVDQLKEAEPDCKIYLCGTKLDLIEEAITPREVLTRAVSSYSRDIGADAFETSSKRGTNVDKVFEKIAEDFMRINKFSGQGKGDIQLENGSRKKLSCCR